MAHTIGSHSDDRGGESDNPCYCDAPQPITPDTNSYELDGILLILQNSGINFARNVRSNPSIALAEAKQAIHKYMLDTFMELIDSTPILFPPHPQTDIYKAELRKAAKEKLT